MSINLPTILGALVADFVAAVQFPGSNTAGAAFGEALGRVVKARADSAREILIEEIRGSEKGLHDVCDLDAAAAMVFRYSRAAIEGTARLNLRLMAKVIAGQAHLGKLIADDFLYYADILASLRREEIILLATLHRLRTDFEREAAKKAHPLMGNGKADHLSLRQLWSDARDQLVPYLFNDEAWMFSTATALTRTGLVVTDDSIDDMGYYKTSPLMDRLVRLASFETALEKEGMHMRPGPKIGS